MSCTSRCRSVLPQRLRAGTGHRRPGRDPSGCRHHHHGCSAGGVWAGYPVPETAAPHGPGAVGEEAQALPAGLAAVAHVVGRSAPGERAQATADPGPAPQGHAAGDHLLPGTGGGTPVHRQPQRGAQASQRAPPQPADVCLGIRPGHRLSHVQSQNSQHRELHWF